jgi:hypothetical protein
VLLGAYTVSEDKQWHYLGPMIMHPEAFPIDPSSSDPSVNADNLAGIYSQLDWHPYLRSADWLRRAEYARQYSGDNADVVLSLQISMTSMLYRTWAMLLIDQGKQYADVASALNSGVRLRRLIVSVLPSLLGGRWDVHAVDTAVGRYWKRLYLLHEEILHNGHQPSWPEAEGAYQAYIEMRDFINLRLWERHKSYPRTLLAKVGEAGLIRRGWDSRWMREFMERIRAEPGYFYLARDLTGRNR